MAVQFNGEKVNLKYLFGAELEDGSIYKQTKDDVSQTVEGKSAFTDIAEQKLKRFWLKKYGEIYEVDLRTGLFTINGKELKCHDEPIKDLRLIYFRRHFHHSNMETGEQTGHEIEYHFGWQCTVGGKNIKQTISIK